MVRADAAGTLSATVTIPADVAVGTHRFAIVGQVDGRALWTELEVLPADASGDSDDDTDGSGSPGGLATTGSHVGALVGLAIVLVAGGIVIVIARRRMRRIPG